MEYLPALFASLSTQEFTDFEWIVVDGGSGDGTPEFLSGIRSLNLRYVSEPDHGIYDAMNKAIAMCRGDFILFMGADDVLADERVLSDVSSCADDDAEAVMGVARDGRGKIFQSTAGFKTCIVNTIHHQSIFYNRKIFDNFRYDTKIPIIADYELNLLLYLKKARLKTIDRLIALCGAEGVSNKTSEFGLYRGMHAIRARYLPAWYSYLLMMIGYANVLKRKIRK